MFFNLSLKTSSCREIWCLCCWFCKIIVTSSHNFLLEYHQVSNSLSAQLWVRLPPLARAFEGAEGWDWAGLTGGSGHLGSATLDVDTQTPRVRAAEGTQARLAEAALTRTQGTRKTQYCRYSRSSRWECVNVDDPNADFWGKLGRTKGESSLSLFKSTFQLEPRNMNTNEISQNFKI